MCSNQVDLATPIAINISHLSEPILYDCVFSALENSNVDDLPLEMANMNSSESGEVNSTRPFLSSFLRIYNETLK